MSGHKLTQETIEKMYQEKGCKLLDKYDNNPKKKVHFICSCGQIGYKSHNAFIGGTPWCKNCTNIRYKESHKKRDYTLDDIKTLLLNNGHVLLSCEYNGYKTPIKYICCCGDIMEVSFIRYGRNESCKKCKLIEYIKMIRDLLEKNGCRLLSETIVDTNTRIKIEFICKCGLKDKKTLESFIEYPMCRECSKQVGIKKNSGPNSYIWKSDRELVKRNEKFRGKCARMVRNCFKKIGSIKRDKTEKILGYKVVDLINKIEMFPNWVNLKNTRWHLDHIMPIQAFLEYGITDLKVINSLDNLQPLSEYENLSKSDKYSNQEFENWLLSKGIKFESKING